jgi:hypothetical protein
VKKKEIKMTGMVCEHTYLLHVAASIFILLIISVEIGTSVRGKK